MKLVELIVNLFAREQTDKRFIRSGVGGAGIQEVAGFVRSPSDARFAGAVGSGAFGIRAVGRGEQAV